MAITTTTRLGIYKWSSGDDAFTRDQLSDSHDALEQRVALFTAGTFALRPAAAASNARGFYLATDQNILYYSDGSNWYSVNSFSNPVAITPGDVITAGTSTFAARADHKHALPDWGAAGELASVGTTAAAGSTAKFARVDHVHVLGAGSVTAGRIATGGISAASMFAAGVIDTTSIGDVQVTKAKIAADQQNPPGLIMAYGGTTAPTGWLLCDGTAVSRTTYADLFAIIGTRYGVGNGSSTFNLPDLRDRMPRGQATTGGTVVTTGADTVTLDVTNLPSHTHPAGTLAADLVGNHQHDYSGGTGYSNPDHVHNVNHGHSAYIADGLSYGGGSYGTVACQTGAADAPQLMPTYWGGRPTDSGVEGTYPQLRNGTVIVNGNNFNSAGTNVNHNHSFSGTTTPAGTHGHTISGSTGTTGSATALNIQPKSQGVNFIIKI